MLPKLEPPGIHQLRALAAAGWQLDIRQWGTITCPSVSANAVSRGSASLPISLSTAVLVSLSEIVDGGTEQNWTVFHWSNGDLTTIKTYAVASVAITNPEIRWMVIGK